jgi:hypothetical protein
MTVPTAGELTNLRTRPHRTRLGLSVYQPDIVFQAQVNNASAALGDVQIPFDNVTTGSYVDALPGLTLYLTDQPTLSRSSFVTKIRLRGATSAYLAVAENSVTWVDDYYLIVVKYHEPWAVYPRSEMLVGTIPTWYKDYNIFYIDQNSKFEPVILMGPNRAGELDAGSIQFYFDASNSYDLTPGGTPVNYTWTFEGGTPNTSASATPGWVTYTAPGHYMVTLLVVSSTGAQHESYRFVSVYDPPEDVSEDAHHSFLKWGITSLAGDYQSGGWEGKLWFREPVGLGPRMVIGDPKINTIVDGSLVVIYAKDWYGATKVSIGGNYPNSENIVFVGYVRDGSVEISPDDSSIVTFGVTGIAGRLDKLEAFGVSVQSFANPGADVSVLPAWAQIKNMTADIAMNHYFRWHSTVYDIVDVRKNGDTRQVKYADFDKSSLYQAADRFLQSSLLAKLCVDRQGQMWMETKEDVIPVASRTTDVSIVLQRHDWRDRITIVQRLEQDVPYVELAGASYSGPSTDISTPLISSAPGNTPGYEGNNPNILSGFILTDQGVTNQLVGDVFENINKPYPEVTIPIAGNYRIFDIAPQQITKLTVLASQNNLGIIWIDRPLISRHVEFRYAVEQQTILTDLKCEDLTVGLPGQDGPYPIIDPPCPAGTADCNPDPCPSGDCNPPPCVNCGGPVPITIPDLLYVFADGKLGRTRNFIAGGASVTWQDATGVASGSGVGTAFCMDPWGPMQGAYICWLDKLWHTSNLDSNPPTWTQVLAATTVESALGIASVTLERLGAANTESGVIYVAWTSTSAGGTVGTSVSKDFGATWAHHAFTTTPGHGRPIIARIMADPATVGMMWLLWQLGDGNGGALHSTTDYGVTFAGPALGFAFQVPEDFDVDGSTAQNIVIRFTPDQVWWSHNGGANWTKSLTTISPSSNSGTMINMNIATLDNTDVLWAETTGRWWHSIDAGINFTSVDPIGAGHGSCANKSIVASGRWPYDKNKVFFLWCQGGVNAWSPINYSDDLLATIQNKTGNWFSVMGGAFTNPVMIVPVWIA